MKKYICGIDENGFGPVLGPLTITGIISENNIKIPEYIKDSKIIYKNKKDFKKIEEITIVVFYILKKRFPKSPYEILKNFVFSKCAFDENICEKNIPFNFQNNIDFYKIIEKYGDLIKAGQKIKDLKVNVVCPYFFNQFINKKNSKFILNLSNFCEIMKYFSEYKSIMFYCGKIGGLNHYNKFLSYFFPDFFIKTIEEKKDYSHYKVYKNKIFFEIFFYKNVEEIAPIASFASIIGKYIREIFMESIRKSLNIEEKISGYRDKNTKKFIEKIDFLRFRKECIIRNA